MIPDGAELRKCAVVTTIILIHHLIECFQVKANLCPRQSMAGRRVIAQQSNVLASQKACTAYVLQESSDFHFRKFLKDIGVKRPSIPYPHFSISPYHARFHMGFSLSSIHAGRAFCFGANIMRDADAHNYRAFLPDRRRACWPADRHYLSNFQRLKERRRPRVAIVLIILARVSPFLSKVYRRQSNSRRYGQKLAKFLPDRHAAIVLPPKQRRSMKAMLLTLP